jgi:hypothetical protein
MDWARNVINLLLISARRKPKRKFRGVSDE